MGGERERGGSMVMVMVMDLDLECEGERDEGVFLGGRGWVNSTIWILSAEMFRGE